MGVQEDRSQAGEDNNGCSGMGVASTRGKDGRAQSWWNTGRNGIR